MFYAFNKNKNLYLYGSDKREITEKSLNDNVKTDIDEWNVIELNEDVVTVNGKQFLRSSVPTAERIAEKAKKNASYPERIAGSIRLDASGRLPAFV